jgi:hypothetical protein
MKRPRLGLFLWIVFLLFLLGAGIWLMTEGSRRYDKAPLLTWSEGCAGIAALCT